MSAIWTAIFVMGLVAGDAAPDAAASSPTDPIIIKLGERHGKVKPITRHDARADGGLIDVRVPTPNSVVVVMTGSVSAYTYLGMRSYANESFELVQEFEITSTDASVTQVVISLESSMAGYSRSKHKAGAGVKLAGVMVRPAAWDNSPLQLSQPVLMVESTDSKLVNVHLPHIEGPVMPLGKYELVMNFLIEAEASGICDGHATAEFSPGTTIPESWVRTRDPFQGVDKTGFGFSAALIARPAPASPFKTEKKKSAATTRPKEGPLNLPPPPGLSGVRVRLDGRPLASRRPGQ